MMNFFLAVIDVKGRPFRMYMGRAQARFWAHTDRADVIDSETGEVLAAYDPRTGAVK